MAPNSRPKVLLIIESCNPNWSSVPLVGYRYFEHMSALADITLVTHARNQADIEKLQLPNPVIYIHESRFESSYFKLIEKCVIHNQRVIWPLYHALKYPLYQAFNLRVFSRLKRRVQAGEFDLVHALTPMEPRYAYKIAQACDQTPFILGPVNGGVPYPAAFTETAKQEFVQLNFLRHLGRWLIPGYAASYRRAARVLAGSTYTRNLVQQLFGLSDQQVSLYYENGVTHIYPKALQAKMARASASQGCDVQSSALESSALESNEHQASDRLNLLFVGRLVPYKGADMVLDAIARLPETLRHRVQLMIVGDGEMRQTLEANSQTLGIAAQVHFTGWVEQNQTAAYYEQADLFCFPSVREYGGAVVLEAMAYGLPCLVVNNGGVGEYVTEQTGIRIEPVSREHVIQALAAGIEQLAADPQQRLRMAEQCLARASAFVWQRKAEDLLAIYQQVLKRSPKATPCLGPTTEVFQLTPVPSNLTSNFKP